MKTITLRYSDNKDSPLSDIYPDINGLNCDSFSNNDVFKERDDALSFIAKLIKIDSDAGIRQAAFDFLKKKGYEYSYETLIENG